MIVWKLVFLALIDLFPDLSNYIAKNNDIITDRNVCQNYKLRPKQFETEMIL